MILKTLSRLATDSLPVSKSLPSCNEGSYRKNSRSIILDIPIQNPIYGGQMVTPIPRPSSPTFPSLRRGISLRINISLRPRHLRRISAGFIRKKGWIWREGAKYFRNKSSISGAFFFLIWYFECWCRQSISGRQLCSFCRIYS